MGAICFGMHMLLIRVRTESWGGRLFGSKTLSPLRDENERIPEDLVGTLHVNADAVVGDCEHPL
jgi:hypothetical protein